MKSRFVAVVLLAMMVSSSSAAIRSWTTSVKITVSQQDPSLSLHNPNNFPVALFIQNGAAFGWLLDGSAESDNWMTLVNEANRTGKNLVIWYDDNYSSTVFRVNTPFVYGSQDVAKIVAISIE